MFQLLFKWILRLFRGDKLQNTNSGLYKFEFIDDVPNHPQFKTIYFIGQENYYWQFVMLCPCGCNSLLHMNMMLEQNPHWFYKIDHDLITITPSIDRIVGCKSHFFIKSGKVVWV